MDQRSVHIPITRVVDGTRVKEIDSVAVEEPLEIEIGYRGTTGPEHTSVSVTMRTPGNDEELTLGFLLTEGVIASAEIVKGVWHVSPNAPDRSFSNVIRVQLQENASVDFDRLKRNFYTTSSCGVCGKSSIEALRIESPYGAAIRNSGFSIGNDSLITIPQKLAEKQRVFSRTGGLHASGLFDARGAIVSVREDVGRHNALDKLIGAALHENRLPLTACGIVVSGRTSFELMQKAVMAGCPMIVAVGAPSSLAIEIATEFKLTLVGFLRNDRYNIYSGAERIHTA